MKKNPSQFMLYGELREHYFLSFVLSGLFLLTSCDTREPRNRRAKVDYIKEISGENDSIPVAIAEKGEVLIAYSDCYTCHKKNEKSIGPAFRDVARRYPVQQIYINMLAQKIIYGGSGGWGQAMMSPHPNLTPDDAKVMASYILSLKEEF